MFDAVIATDDKGAVKLYNAAALNILDTNEDLTGKPIETYLTLVDQQGETVHMLKLTQGGTQSLHSSDYLLKGADGEEIIYFT